MQSPTQSSLKLLRKNGYTAEVVEHWNPHVRRRKDLFGFIDIIAIKEGETLAVQTTSYKALSARKKKILEHENYEIVKKSGWRIVAHGWRKPKYRWEVKEIEL